MLQYEYKVLLKEIVKGLNFKLMGELGLIMSELTQSAMATTVALIFTAVGEDMGYKRGL